MSHLTQLPLPSDNTKDQHKGSIFRGCCLCHHTAFSATYSSSPKGSSKAGIIKGSLDGLKQHERIFVNDLISQGKNVEIIPKGPGKTPDFFVDCVKTELKTLKPQGGEANLNTAITRIKEGFQQQPEVVILDGRSVSLTKAQAQNVISRTVGTFKESGGVPGKIEIWTIEGVVKYP